MSTTGTGPDPRGLTSAAGCYVIWGLVPLYWKQLVGIDALELIAHRHVWSLVFVGGLLLLQGKLGEVRAALSGGRAVAINFLSAVLLTVNWLVYVWGVNNGHLVETSLGYFLVPLVNVASGRFVFGEHLRPLQWIAIGSAALGVSLLVFQLGRPPWIALALAGSWGGYSLLRKKSPLGALTGLTLETLLLVPFAVAFLAWQHHEGAGALGHVSLGKTVLVLCAGVVTAVPLLLFAYSARRIRLSTLGIMQYVTPTVQFLLGVFVYHEAFPRERLISFGFIWAALALYTTDTILGRENSSVRAKERD